MSRSKVTGLNRMGNDSEDLGQEEKPLRFLTAHKKRRHGQGINTKRHTAFQPRVIGIHNPKCCPPIVRRAELTHSACRDGIKHQPEQCDSWPLRRTWQNRILVVAMLRKFINQINLRNMFHASMALASLAHSLCIFCIHAHSFFRSCR